MRRSPAFVVLCVALTAAAVFVHGCAGGDKLELGPKPAKYSGGLAFLSQIVDHMRAWLEALGPEKAKTLQETGEVVFAYEQLKISDPVHAQIVEAYLKKAEAALPERVKAKGMPGPIFTVETFSFVRVTRQPRGQPIRGAYEFRIEFADGTLDHLQLSDPL